MSADTGSIPESPRKQADATAAELDDTSQPSSPHDSNPAQAESVHQPTPKMQHIPAENTRGTECTPDSVFQPAGDLKELHLADFFDVANVQSLMDEFYTITGIGMAIVDLHGEVLVSTGWQDICTRFHRVHPESCKNCIESDTLLSSGITPGEHKLYKCKNNLWDMATPIVIGERHVGNLFLGQFFFDDEIVDRELFRKQAQQYGFDETAYLAALDRVPRWSHEKIRSAFRFYMLFADRIARLSHSNLMLSRALAERDYLVKELTDSKSLLDLSQQIAHLGSWKLELAANLLTWSDETYRIFGCKPQEFAAIYETFIDIVHPEDRYAVDAAYKKSLNAPDDGYEIDHRIVRKDTGEVRYVHEKCIHERDATGAIIQSLGMVQDITERKQAELKQLEHMHELQRWHAATINREDRVLELKREVNELLRRAGQPIRYPSATIG